MIFDKIGVVKFYKNNVLLEKNKIIFVDFYKTYNQYVYGIYLDNNAKKFLTGRVYDDSLYSFYYPFKRKDSDCSDYRNYFVKE